MTSFESFINQTHKNIQQKYEIGQSTKEVILGRFTKFVEESGELAEQILGSQLQMRPEKAHKFSQEFLEDEFADVIITINLLAKSMNVDIQSSLEKKIEHIKKRGGV